MTEHKGLPVAGYQPQSADSVSAVNEHKEMEERLLRCIESLSSSLDGQWAAVAKTHFEQGLMALNRAVFKPGRVKLTTDKDNA